MLLIMLGLWYSESGILPTQMHSGSDTLHYTIPSCGSSPDSGSDTSCNADSLKKYLLYHAWALTSHTRASTCMHGCPLHHTRIPAPYAGFPHMHASFPAYLGLNTPHPSTPHKMPSLSCSASDSLHRPVPNIGTTLTCLCSESPCRIIPLYMSSSLLSQALTAIIGYILTLGSQCPLWLYLCY